MYVTLERCKKCGNMPELYKPDIELNEKQSTPLQALTVRKSARFAKYYHARNARLSWEEGLI